MLPEYDFSQARRNHYAALLLEGISMKEEKESPPRPSEPSEGWALLAPEAAYIQGADARQRIARLIDTRLEELYVKDTLKTREINLLVDATRKLEKLRSDVQGVIDAYYRGDLDGTVVEALEPLLK